VKRKRRITGRTIIQKQLPKKNPTLEEIALGQIERDVRRTTKEEKISSSPYWTWLEKRGYQADSDDRMLEIKEANPDILGEYVRSANFLSKEELMDVIKMSLTDKQAEVMRLVLEGFSQTEIASIIGVKQGYISQVIKVSRNKLREYFPEDAI
jgi:DNA-directed RNA polymerase specialized sigma subunit